MPCRTIMPKTVEAVVGFVTIVVAGSVGHCDGCRHCGCHEGFGHCVF